MAIRAKDGTGQDINVAANGLGTVASPFIPQHSPVDPSGQYTAPLTQADLAALLPAGLIVTPEGLKVNTGLNFPTELASEQTLSSLDSLLQDIEALLESYRSTPLTVNTGLTELATDKSIQDLEAVIAGGLTVDTGLDLAPLATADKQDTLIGATQAVVDSLAGTLVFNKSGLATSSQQASIETAVEAVETALLGTLDVDAGLTDYATNTKLQTLIDVFSSPIDVTGNLNATIDTTGLATTSGQNAIADAVDMVTAALGGTLAVDTGLDLSALSTAALQQALIDRLDQPLDISAAEINFDGSITLADGDVLEVRPDPADAYEAQKRATRTCLVGSINSAADAQGTGYIDVVPAPPAGQAIFLDELCITLSVGSSTSLFLSIHANDLRWRLTLNDSTCRVHSFLMPAAQPLRIKSASADIIVHYYLKYFILDSTTGLPV